MKVRWEEEPLMENPDAGVPTLTGYAGYDWLKEFIKNPAHGDFYGENNLMPAFETKLTEEQIELLVRWMVGDYIPTHLTISSPGSVSSH